MNEKDIWLYVYKSLFIFKIWMFLCNYGYIEDFLIAIALKKQNLLQIFFNRIMSPRMNWQ